MGEGSRLLTDEDIGDSPLSTLLLQVVLDKSSVLDFVNSERDTSLSEDLKMTMEDNALDNFHLHIREALLEESLDLPAVRAGSLGEHNDGVLLNSFLYLRLSSLNGVKLLVLDSPRRYL